MSDPVDIVYTSLARVTTLESIERRVLEVNGADREDALLSLGAGVTFSIVSILVVNVILFFVYLHFVLRYPSLPWTAVVVAVNVLVLVLLVADAWLHPEEELYSTRFMLDPEAPPPPRVNPLDPDHSIEWLQSLGDKLRSRASMLNPAKRPRGSLLRQYPGQPPARRAAPVARRDRRPGPRATPKAARVSAGRDVPAPLARGTRPARRRKRR